MPPIMPPYHFKELVWFSWFGHFKGAQHAHEKFLSTLSILPIFEHVLG